MKYLLLFIIFCSNPLFATKLPHDGLIQDALTDSFIQNQPSTGSLSSNYLNCRDNISSLPDCYQLVTHLKGQRLLNTQQILEVENFVNKICLKKVQEFYSPVRISILKGTISNPFCLSAISNRESLLRYKGVDNIEN